MKKANALNSVQISRPSTNAFDLSHDVKLTLDMGFLYPVLTMECIPGDRVKLGCEQILRMLPILAPIMHRVDVRAEYFFCPNRLIWPNWETWITNGGDNPTQVNPLPAHPYIEYAENAVPAPPTVNYSAWPLMDYMDLPDPSQCPFPDTYVERVSALPFGCYQKVIQDYYRDENLQAKEGPEEMLIDGNNGANAAALLTLRRRCWEADYFTKALPFAQKGAPVNLPLAEWNDVTVAVNAEDYPTDAIMSFDAAGNVSGPTTVQAPVLTPVGTAVGASEMFARTSDLQNQSTTINDLRLAFRLQEWLEKNARGGTRYSELIRAHFNVRPEDSRLQRPEYIVGVKNPVQISEVLNTTGTDEAPQGSMAGHGIAYSRGNMGKYFCTEHGYIICLLSVMPKPSYQQGIPKHFTKFTDPTQLAWPTFGTLGEQEIQNKEIMAFAGPDPVIGSEATFGYTPRYMEYKTLPNRVCGQFRTTLDFWHMGRIFDPSSPPALNAAFVEADPTTRIFAVEEENVNHLICQVMHHITVVRALPFYGTPSF